MFQKPLFLASLLFIVTNTFAIQVDIQRISPDKNTLALAFDDGVIRLYSLDSGKLTQELTGHEDAIQTLDFNASGTRLISGGWDGQAILWSTENGTPIEKKFMSEAIMNVYFTAGDKNIALLEDEKLLTLHDAKLSGKKGTFPLFNMPVISPDRKIIMGQSIQILKGNDPSVTVIDFENGGQITDIPEDVYDDEIFFSPDSALAMIRDFSVFHVWNIKDHAKKASLKADVDVESATVNPASDKEILIYGENRIETWDYTSGKQIGTFTLSEKNIDKISHIALSGDGKSAAISAWLQDETSVVYIMDLATQHIRTTITPASKVCFTSEFINDTTLLLHSSYPIEVWDTDNNKIIYSLTESGWQ